MATEIRCITPGEAGYGEVKRLRYEIYAGEERLDIPGMDAAARTMADELDAVSLILGAFDGEEAVASIRMTPVDALPADSDQRELFGTAQFGVPEAQMFIIGRLMVGASRRGSPACTRLLAALYAHAVRDGFELGFLACRPRQLPMYESVGCRRYRSAVGHAQFGLLVPMVHLLRDLQHAARVPFPLLSPALGVMHNEPLSIWFERTFGTASRPCSVRLMSPQDFSTLARAIAACSCAPFADIATHDLEWLLKSSALLELPAGTRIVPQGSRGSELYVLLSGQVAVATEDAATSGAVTLLHPGQVFAEREFLWKGAQASGQEITALGPVRLLSISADAFGTSRLARPDVAANFYLGLSRALSERLHGQTDRPTTMSEALRKVIKRMHYPAEVMMLTCIGWHAVYLLNLRHIEEMMQGRGVFVDHATVHR